jgi:hypothetical protein
MDEIILETSASLLRSREKRKWQIALRRYIVEKQVSFSYAPYFGLDILNFRNWIEIQFNKEMNWDNFGKIWQLDHIVPVVYFDQSNKNDLKLCWNFINIRVEKTHLSKFHGNSVDVLTAKTYFINLLRKTGYSICSEMIKKVEEIEKAQLEPGLKPESFILENLNSLKAMLTFNEYEFMKLNTGFTMNDVLEERKLLIKFGK